MVRTTAGSDPAPAAGHDFLLQVGVGCVRHVRGVTRPGDRAGRGCGRMSACDRNLTFAGTPSARSMRHSPAGSRSWRMVTATRPFGSLVTVQAARVAGAGPPPPGVHGGRPRACDEGQRHHGGPPWPPLHPSGPRGGNQRRRKTRAGAAGSAGDPLVQADRGRGVRPVEGACRAGAASASMVSRSIPSSVRLELRQEGRARFRGPSSSRRRALALCTRMPTAFTKRPRASAASA